MKKSIFLFIIICFGTRLTGQDATIIYKNNVNSTVTIETDICLGSGFFISDSIIATNYHVIDGASEAYCYTNNSPTKYKIDGYIAVDKQVDIILLKVSGLNRKAIKMSTSTVEPGQKIYVMGSPKGLPATISDGIVSGLRVFEGYNLIQITAPISHGSSGGPVLNAKGELIGVSVGQYEGGQNLNFAIPKINIEQLLQIRELHPISIKTLYNFSGTLIDRRDGRTYKTIRIGTQTWMAENLNFDTSPVLYQGRPSILSDSWCYDGNNINCSKYGRLYIWEKAVQVCPTGWHLPTDAEWSTLTDYLGWEGIAGKKLKSLTGWDNPSSTSTNESGFSALPGGYGTPTYNQGIGIVGFWWSSTELNADEAYSRNILNNKDEIFRHAVGKRMGASVRCIKD
jgi:uncharacterized protein (TIGR02145 family)